jgi:U3 small nucleolar RNA-associated protein 6
MDRKIFSEGEVRAIVARRRESEYLLRRRAARKADFLRYIEAEQGLEKLRGLRTVQRKRDTRRKRQDEEGFVKEEQKIGDTHIIQHLHLLFVRLIRKFRSDLSLHIAHADFCKEHKSFNRLGRVYAEALQIFPRQTGLWIEAASQEFFGPTRSMGNARVLLQRGLRINSKSEELWMEYFSLEMHYAQTLKGRRQILQGSSGDEDYKIPMIVYKNAIQAIPDSVSFRLHFLDTCGRFPDMDFIVDHIQSSLQKDFESQPEAWIARALYVAQKQSKPEETTKMEQSAADQDEEEEDRPAKKQRPEVTEPVLAVLKEAVEKVSSDEMYLQALRFARSYQNQLEEDAKVLEAGKVGEFIKALLEDEASGYSSSDLALEHADFYLISLDQKEKAIQVLDQFCSTQKSASATVWIRWAALSSETAITVLERSLSRIPISDHDHMKVLLQLFGVLLVKGENEKKIADCFHRILLLSPGFPELVVEDAEGLEFGIQTPADAYLKYLQYAMKASGVNGARKVYTAVLFQSTPHLNENNAETLRAFIDLCLQVEKADKKRLRRLYDQVIELFHETSLEAFYRDERNEKVIYR